MPVPVSVSSDAASPDVVATYYDASNQPIYTCYARPFTPLAHSLPAPSAGSAANPCVITSTAHKLPVGSRATVTIAGITGTGWTGLNGTRVATYVDANSFSIPVDASGFSGSGTYTAATATTNYPTTDQAIWKILGRVYSSGNEVLSGWADGSQAYMKVADSRTLYGY